MKSMRSLYKKLFHYVPDKRIWAYFSMALSAAAVCSYMGAYWFLWQSIVSILVIPVYEKAMYDAIIVVILMILRGILNIASATCSHYLGFRLETNLRKNGLHKLLDASSSFFDHNSSGEIRKIIDDNAAETHKTVAHLIPDNVTAVMTPVLMFVLMFAIDYRLTDSNLNHTGIYLYSKGKIMIHLTFDYKTDEKCTTPGQYLKYHRTFQGLSTRELAEKVGIVPATLVLYENDRHPIKHSTAVALANALGIDRNRLLDKYTAFVDYPYSSLLKKVRQDLSLTQIQMAELIGIGQTSYSGWEREIRVPRRKEYDKILAALEKLRVNVDTYLCQSASI